MKKLSGPGGTGEFKPPNRGAVSAVAFEFHVRNLDVSAAVANITSIKVGDHGQEPVALYAVSAPDMVNRVQTRVHFHSLVPIRF